MAQFILALGLCLISVPAVRSLTISINESKQAPAEIRTGSEGYIIVAGGLNNHENVARSYAYDINSGIWAALPDLPSPRYGGGLVAHQGNVYYASGYREGYGGFKEVLMLLTEQNAWIKGATLNSVAHDGASAVSLNGSLYVLGGDTYSLEKFDCSLGRYAWGKSASTLQRHEYSGVAVLNDYIYVCGTTWGNSSDFCERYDPATDAWSSITPMNENRERLSMVALNGYLYVIGGADAHNERYDPASGEWSYFSNVPSQQYFQAAATDGKKIYVVGGAETDGVMLDMNVYLPEFDIWQQQDPYPTSISRAGIVFIESLP